MHVLFRSNLLRLVVLTWFSGWLLLVMPGHTRGVVSLPGAEVAASAEADSSCCDTRTSCCERVSPCCDANAESEGDTTPKPIDPAKHCAICFLKSHLTDAPPAVLYTPYLGELDELAYHCESSVLDDRSAPLRTRGRAPPM
jgi:hypothetical protein